MNNKELHQAKYVMKGLSTLIWVGFLGAHFEVCVRVCVWGRGWGGGGGGGGGGGDYPPPPCLKLDGIKLKT